MVTEKQTVKDKSTDTDKHKQKNKLTGTYKQTHKKINKQTKTIKHKNTHTHTYKHINEQTHINKQTQTKKQRQTKTHKPGQNCRLRLCCVLDRFFSPKFFEAKVVPLPSIHQGLELEINLRGIWIKICYPNN